MNNVVIRGRPWLNAAVLLLVGGYLAFGGTVLLGLGGSAYYAIAGVVLIVSGGLLFSRRRGESRGTMKVGVYFPQYELPSEADALKDYVQGVEELGYDHIVIMDHVIGANKASRPGWTGSYHLDTLFHEPFALIAFLSGVTSRLGFMTGVLVLPQRQTTLVAKQAACIDIYCKGRLRLGIGTGWNQVEYESLNASFEDRGKVFNDQIEVLRALWTQRTVTLKSAYHTITDAGIHPLPLQRPIPLWFGGGNKAPANLPHSAIDKVLRRIARLGDGWLPPFGPGEEAVEGVERFRALCREYGRDPNAIGIEGIVKAHGTARDQWADDVAAWRKLGASHVGLNTIHDGLTGVEAHLRRLEEFRPLSQA
jgi:probable F420-dependent oxidoreductase